MGCEDHKGGFNCVVDAVYHIHEMQEAVEDECNTSCFSNLLSNTQSRGDTIPFILFCRSDCNDLFSAFGNVGRLFDGSCFQSVFFRVNSIKGSCATLQLLRPFDGRRPISVDSKKDVCDVTRLVKTDYCVEVDLDCFCAIQCLDPDLLRGSGRDHDHDCDCDESSSSSDDHHHHHHR
ncbi:spore coat protein [Bacillaceae bacterium SIJ1]|uniref:CotY/CotZ family spore coat protein n=1 Tax=Litoribacterium kuwaitense TaxID=1398745 RepID=UPI0013EC318B|nr:CotY/CotZ family spore coat protein [Litoribacterium kuwaitense]NGP46157.1 spore coat protein [Litoribacterium kuwaitense]